MRYIVATTKVNQEATFSIADTKLCGPFVNLSALDNKKLLEQLKSGFKRTINLNRYQSKISAERQNQYLDYLIGPSFQGVNRLFILSFEDKAKRTSYKLYYLPTVEMKHYDVMIDGQNFFDQPVRHKLITYVSIRKFATIHGDYYTTAYLLDYNYFKTIIRR